MTMYDRAPAESWSASPARRMVILLALAIALMLMPDAWTHWLRRSVQSALRPGQVAATSLTGAADYGLARIRGLLATSQHYAELERQVDVLRQRNAQLEAAAIVLAQETTRADDSWPSLQSSTPLVTTRLVEARVIGRHVQSLLRDEATLDLGTADGLQAGAWTLDAENCLIDQGEQSQLRRGELVLAGRRVLGKVLEAGRYASRVQRPTDAGYRDLVQLAYRQGQRMTLGPRGVLEGVGESLCRVRMIPVTESVSAGDVLLTAGSEGIAASGMLYGEVVRVERPAGATHWDIWMRPAAAGQWPDRVAVVTASVAEPAAAVMAASTTATKGRR